MVVLAIVHLVANGRQAPLIQVLVRRFPDLDEVCRRKVGHRLLLA